MQFRFTAKDANGRIVESTREARDKFSLVHELRKEGLSVLSASPATKTFGDYFKAINESVVRVPLKDKINFANNLGSMISAGLPLSRALKILERQTKNLKLKQVAQGVMTEIDAGGSLSEALAKYEHIFSSVFIAMIRAGEQSGNVPGALTMIGEQMSKTYTIERKIKGAMMYPLVIIGIMIIISILMLMFVVPTLTATFASMKVALPWQTKLIITTSSFLLEHFFLTVGMLLGMIAVLFWLLSKPVGKRFRTYVVLHMPVVSKIVKESNAAKTARTLSSLISSGVDMIQALETTKGVVNNSRYQEVLEEAVAAVEKGKPLAEVFQAHEDLYPILLGEMMEVGEETGNLAGMLQKTAIFYEEEVDAATKDMSTIIEPLLMLLIGGAVGFFAISIIQPIYSVGNSIG